MSEVNQDENVMERLTTEFAEYICDMVCGNLDDVRNQEDADKICAECKMGKFVCDICNEYNTINDFEKSQIAVLLKENARLKNGYQDIVKQLEDAKIKRMFVFGRSNGKTLKTGINYGIATAIEIAKKEGE